MMTTLKIRTMAWVGLTHPNGTPLIPREEMLTPAGAAQLVYTNMDLAANGGFRCVGAATVTVDLLPAPEDAHAAAN
jgi:hypothetical protein